jgi:hypothetical protein
LRTGQLTQTDPLNPSGPRPRAGRRPRGEVGVLKDEVSEDVLMPTIPTTLVLPCLLGPTHPSDRVDVFALLYGIPVSAFVL